MELSLKQTIAIDYLEDDCTNEVFFGGAAGGGKSALGCYWQLKNRLKYPETRGLIGRSKLKALKSTTLKTFFEIGKMQGLKLGTHYKYNENNSLITFFNGSEIVLKDLFAYPADKDFEGLGSLEITDAFIDESPQITKKAKDILKSRIRFKLDDYGLTTKLLMVGNPSKNWTYKEFYKPNKEGILEPNKKFIQSLLTDNPYISKHYRENLLTLDKVTKERLLFGNWEYDDDDNSLMDYDSMIDMFTNSFVKPTAQNYITADIALYGSDKFVLGVWSGLVLKDIIVISKAEADDIEKKIKEVAEKEKVPISNIVYDADGLGSFLRGYLRGAKPFHNGSKPFKDENYANLKTQCSYKLSEKINAKEIYIIPKTYKEEIIEELQQIEKLNADSDGKMQIVKKDKVKELLGRSPDFSDMLMMRMYFEYKTTSTTWGSSRTT